jgi:hypothetical protein
MTELSELSELGITQMSPQDLMVYLTSNRREDEYKESRVRQILKTDVMITDDQLRYLFSMLECLDMAFEVVGDRREKHVCTAKRYAKIALESDLTDRHLIANIYKVLSTPQTERFFPKQS